MAFSFVNPETEPLELVLFDCDGTITHSLDLAMESFLYGMRAVGAASVEPEEILAWYGISADKIFKNVLSDTPHLAPLAFEAFLEHQREEAYRVHVHRGMDVVLNRLFDSMVPMGIVTGRHSSDLQIMLDYLELDHLFQVRITDDQLTLPKPAPEGLFKALQHFQIDASKAVYIGDSPGDVAAARAAGMKSVGVHWDPKCDIAKMRAEQPDYFIASPDELFVVFRDLGLRFI